MRVTNIRGGWMADRLGRRRAFLIFVALAFAGYVVYLFSPSCGLQLISQGFPLVTNDDHETAARAAFVYDSLYESIESSSI